MRVDATMTRRASDSQIKAIATHLAEGVILINVDQTLSWANDAALAMHGVRSVAELGRTIDEYHANFQVRFRPSQPTAAANPIESVAAGSAFRDVVIEVTPLGGDRPQWVHRIRNLVITDDAGQPTCIALVLHAVNEAFPGREQYASSIDSNPHASLILRISDQTILAANQAFLTFAGVSKQDVIAHTLADLHIATSGGEPGHATWYLAHPKPMGPMFAEMPAAGGETRRVLVAGQPIDVGAERCMLLTFADDAASVIDSAEQMGGDLAARAELLCAITAAPMFVLTPAMRIAGVSEAAAEWLGQAEDKLLGHAITDFMTPEAAAHFNDHTAAALRGAKTLRDTPSQFARGSGAVADVLLSATSVTDAADEVLGTAVTLVDVTELKRGEDRFNKLFALSPVPMVIRRRDDFRILDANKAFVQAIGYPLGAVIGHSFDELGLFETRTQRHQFELELRVAGPDQSLSLRLRSAAGEILDCAVLSEQIQLCGQPCSLLILQDVTARRRDEVHLFQAIETVMKDTSWFSRTVIEKLATIRAPAASGSRSTAINDLTKRERDVLGLISHGLSDADIAEKLGLTRSTVRNHVAALYSKIGVHDRRNAIVWARERGINIAWPQAMPPLPARREAVTRS
ncbi:MAG TPA: PAS domain S-box protein [Acetobacteraceae bacterium]|nr:PAS domain S-box protein [Acetobacteraceae bacterium]